MAHEPTDFRLPPGVIGLVDLGRLSRELQAIDEFVVQASVREAGKQPTLPRTSRNLDQLVKDNSYNLLRDVDRQELRAFLEAVRSRAPVIHMSFATADPSIVFLQKMIIWLRTEIHPLILLQVGLRPGLAAGCIVRTANKYFDFSLRKHFDQNKQVLIDMLQEGSVVSGG